MHLNPAKPLPQDLKTFADSAGSDGFIFFSLGSAIKGSEMPEKNRQLFLRVFSKLKQKVFWKWETETMEGLPPNVKLGKWLPQQDILGHPNCKLFITHGGLGGTTEAIYHGIPMVGIPMFGDQMLNMRKSEGAGYAVSIEYNDLTEENLYEAIARVIGEPKYKNKIQHLSNVYRDQLDKPLDRAVFWVEYVLRHKGAMHLRSPARDLNFFQYFSLDVIGALLAAIFIAIYMIFATLRFLVRKVCGSGSSKTKSSVNGSKKKTN
jgi:UDP:flavonoid glycosyltransferase YjiC (YdhE family)